MELAGVAASVELSACNGGSESGAVGIRHSRNPRFLSGHRVKGVDPVASLRHRADVDQPAAHDRGVLHPGAGVAHPELRSTSGVQGVHVVVVGPDVHHSSIHRGGRPYHVARFKAPHHAATHRIKGIDVAVVGTNVRHPVGHGRRIDNPAVSETAPAQRLARLGRIEWTLTARGSELRSALQEADDESKGWRRFALSVSRRGFATEVRRVQPLQPPSQAVFGLLAQFLVLPDKDGER